MDGAVREALNEQIKHELAAAYLYLAMSAHFSNQSLEGFARWMRLQAQEELGHAMRLFDYLLERGESVALHEIEAPPTTFGSPVSIFQMALDHERAVTQAINDLYALAVEKADYPTQLQLQWFINEQVEEEATAGLVLEQLRRVGDDTAVLLMLDDKLGARQDTE